MLGLIMKDFINLKKNMRIIPILAVVYAIMAITTEDANFFTAIFTMLFAILNLSLFSYDEMAKWDTYAITLPITKNNLIQVKYMMMLILTFIGALFSMIFSTLINFFKNEDAFQTNLIACGLGAATVILFYCITLPIIIKLGVEKARLVFFVVYFVPLILLSSFSKIIEAKGLTMPDNVKKILNFLVENSYLAVPLLVIIALVISYNISLRIYKKKEF